MNPRLHGALPWIVIFIAIVLVLGFLAWLGYDQWSDTVL